MKNFSNNLHIARAHSSDRIFYLLFLPICFIIVGCTPRIHISWDSPQPEIHSGTSLLLDGIEVGRVTDIFADTNRTVVKAKLHRKHAQSIRMESAFLFQPATPDSPAHIRVTVLRADSPPVTDGVIFQGSDNEIEIRLRSATSNWKESAIILGLVIIIPMLLLAVAKAIFRMGVMLFCLAGGVAGAWFAPPYIHPYIQSWIPANFRPELLVYPAGFLAAYLATLLLITIVFAPIAATRQ